MVTLYRRAKCGLCDEALQVLDRLAPRLGFTVAEVNIETDAELLDRYLLAIPVVVVGGREIARAPISALRLEDALGEVFKG